MKTLINKCARQIRTIKLAILSDAASREQLISFEAIAQNLAINGPSEQVKNEAKKLLVSLEQIKGYHTTRRILTVKEW